MSAARIREAGIAGNISQACAQELAGQRKLWTSELGTLWALETADGLPPPCPARIMVQFAEARSDDYAELAQAMGLPSVAPLRQRLQGLPHNRRRCFILRAGEGKIAAYGWVTRGVECVGELERAFHLQRDEAYIWDCVTLPAWRGQRLYSALLSHIIYRLHGEGLPRLWVGAGRQNRPSVGGIANAGFRHVVDANYYRLSRFSLFWMKKPLSAPNPLVAEAYRVMRNAHERRIGRLFLGIQR
jgi:GNAT superfamily N-acetyltransferase